MFDTIISAKELNENLSKEDWVIMDCRYSSLNKDLKYTEYLEAHIPNARYAHMDKDLSGSIIPNQTGRHPFPEPDDFIRTIQSWGIYNHTQVIVYDDNHGALASRLWYMLKYVGHSKVAVLNGGYKEWTRLKYSTNNALPAEIKSDFKGKPNPEMLVSLKTVVDRSQNETACLVDSRASNRYHGEVEPLDPIAGHIPSALNYPFASNVDSDGLWKSKAEIKERFQSLLQKEELIFYCGSGVTACHNLLALHYIGFTNAKLYPGSWSEWITDPSREIA